MTTPTMQQRVRMPVDGRFWIDEERPDDGVALVYVHGDADLHVAPQLRRRLGTAMDEGVSSLVVDLSGVTFVDSTLLGVLLGASKRLTAEGGRLRVVVPQSDVRRIFELTLLDRVLAIDTTRNEAHAAVGLLPRTRG